MQTAHNTSIRYEYRPNHSNRVHDYWYLIDETFSNIQNTNQTHHMF